MAVVVVVVAVAARKGNRRNMTLPNVSLQICVELYFLSKSSNHWPLISNSFYKGGEEISGDITGGVSIILNLTNEAENSYLLN